MLMLEALLNSSHRTLDPAEADYFYVPLLEWEGCWGPHEALYRAHRYVTTVWPFWNRTGGVDHVWFVSRDSGSCQTPWGSLREELGASVVLTHWGAATGLDGKESERCYRSGQDVVVPGSVRPFKTRLSPFWDPSDVAQHAQRARRDTQLFFFGALCWPSYKAVATLDALRAKCNASYEGRGRRMLGIKRYSFGIRDELFFAHRDEPGFVFYATDFRPSMPRRKVDMNELMLRSKYCLCPTGAGWGMRAVHAALLGCVPVLVQHDGTHSHVAQPFEPDGLDWSTFAVRVARNEMHRLPAILAATNLTAKQLALSDVWSRMLWRQWLPDHMRAKLPGPDAFDTTMEVLRRRLELRVRAPPDTVQLSTQS